MAFCGKCGAKIVDSTRFCPSCGAAVLKNQQPAENQPQQQTIRQTSDNNNMGELLVSTKTGAGRKTVQFVCCVFEFILGLSMLFCIKLVQEAADELSGIMVALCLVVGFMCIISPILFIIGSKSHCNVYENGVTGITSLSLSHPNTPMQNFRITYDEIINVAEARNTLYIYTKYTTYEILAITNRAVAIESIRSRMSGNAEK